MEKVFRWIALFWAVVLSLGVSAPGLADWASSAGQIAVPEETAQVLMLLEPLATTTWSVLLAGLSVGLATGAWVSWLLRNPLGRRQLETAGLADEMAGMMHRMRAISEACHSSSYDEKDMVLAYSDFQALQMSLQGCGLRVPWRHWEPGEDPVPYLKANIGYLAFIEPLMRKGHLTVAIRTTRKSLRLGGAPRGPLMKVGTTLRRVA